MLAERDTAALHVPSSFSKLVPFSPLAVADPGTWPRPVSRQKSDTGVALMRTLSVASKESYELLS